MKAEYSFAGGVRGKYSDRFSEGVSFELGKSSAAVQPELKRLHSPDVDLERYRPESESFGFLVQAMVGPTGIDSEESFSFMLCSPSWLAGHYANEIVLGAHHLIVPRYEYQRVLDFVAKFVSSCGANTWTEVAQKLSRLGSWEFSGY